MNQKHMALIALVALSIVSLGFVTLVDRFFAYMIGLISDQYLWIAYARFPSFLVSLGILAVIDRTSLRFNFKNANWIASGRAAIFWLVPAAVGIFVMKVWVPNISGWINVLAFMGTGLFAEEFLFRGSLYALSLRVFDRGSFLKTPFAVFYTSIFFAAQHLQYHSFELTKPAFVQMLYTFVMGYFFGMVRHHTRSIWAVIAVHMLNNSFTIVRDFGGGAR